MVCVSYRGVTSGLTSEAHEVSRSAFCLSKTKRSFAQRAQSTQREHRVHRENTEKCPETPNFKGHRGVTNGTPRYILRLSQEGIAPSRKKGRLRRDARRVGLSRGNQRDPAIRLLFFNLSRTAHKKRVSRRRKKKERLRRDNCRGAAMPERGYRGVTSGLTSEAHEVSRHPSEVIAG